MCCLTINVLLVLRVVSNFTINTISQCYISMITLYCALFCYAQLYCIIPYYAMQYILDGHHGRMDRQDILDGHHGRVDHQDILDGHHGRVDHQDILDGHHGRVDRQDIVDGHHGRVDHQDILDGHHGRVDRQDIVDGHHAEWTVRTLKQRRRRTTNKGHQLKRSTTDVSLDEGWTGGRGAGGELYCIITRLKL